LDMFVKCQPSKLTTCKQIVRESEQMLVSISLIYTTLSLASCSKERFSFAEIFWVLGTRVGSKVESVCHF